MQDNEKESRADGYKNLMNKYGTQDDVSEQYRFESDDPVTDVELTLNYEENGLFAKIIDIPSDDAVSSGFEYGVNDVDLETFINDSLDELDFEGAASTAIKWSRLYGGSLMVMIIDDGKQIDEPVDWDNIRGIDELLVFERPLITPDYNSIYNYDPKTGKWSKFGKPEFYDVSPMYGKQFRVHESRCLLFKNGTLPQSSSRTEYRFFGMPEYTRIHKALQETVTSHGNGVKLLDRAVQAIYKMNDLANLLETDEEGRPPHSVEIIVDGGDETSIASIILDKKAAGIQTFGSITVNVATEYGDSIPVSFNRPEYIYVWMKVTLDADKAYLPTNYANLAINSIVKDASKLQAGDNMLSQTFNDGIYSAVGGVTYVDIKCAATKDKERIPTSDEYTKVNINVESRQKIVVADTRIEVVYSGHS